MDELSAKGYGREPTKPRVSIRKDDLDGLEDRIASLEVGYTGMSEDLKGLSADMTTIKEIMYGDQKEPGILERLRLIECFMGDLKRIGWAILAILLSVVVIEIYNIYVVHAAEVMGR